MSNFDSRTRWDGMLTVSSPKRNPSREQLAWAAGVLEGEGWFGFYRPEKPCIEMESTDEDVVLMVQEIFGVGLVSYRKARNERSQNTFRWTVRRRDEVAYVLTLIDEFMGARRSERIAELRETL